MEDPFEGRGNGAKDGRCLCKTKRKLAVNVDALLPHYPEKRAVLGVGGNDAVCISDINPCQLEVVAERVHYEGCILHRRVGHVGEFPSDKIVYTGILGPRNVDNDIPFASVFLGTTARLLVITPEQSAGRKGLVMDPAASCCVMKASTTSPCSRADGEFWDEERQAVEGMRPMGKLCLIPSTRAATNALSGWLRSTWAQVSALSGPRGSLL